MRLQPKLWLKHLFKWQYLGLCLIVLFTLTVHFVIINSPDKLLFDERFYVSEARAVIAGERALLQEQPPLGKLLIVTGIRLLGDNPFGWRFFSILFGTLSIVFFYFICRRLNLSGRASVMASFLFGLENLSFVQASVAMLDVYSVAFMLAAFLLYLRGNHLTAGVCIGLSALAKLSGGLALVAVVFYWLFTRRRHWQGLVVPAISAVVSFLVLLPILDYVLISRLTSPFARIGYMLGFARRLTFAGGYSESASYPWDWLFNRGTIFYGYEPQYIALISPTVLALTVPVLVYMLIRATRGNHASLLGLVWFAGIYLAWIPLVLATDRLTYIYYFFPAAGAVCIGLGEGLSQLMSLWSQHKAGIAGTIAVLAVSGYLVLHFAAFAILSPAGVPLVRWFPAPTDAGSAGVFSPVAGGFTAQLHLGRAVKLYEEGDRQKALEEFTRAIEDDAAMMRAYAYRGRLYSDMERYSEALADCDRAIALAPEMPDLYAIRAEIYLKMRLWDKAIADCDRAIALEPLRAAGAYLTRGAAYLELRQFQQAIADCTKSILLEPGRAEAYNTRGIAYGSARQYARAIADFSQAIKINPELSEAYYNRGITYRLTGEKAKAIADLNRFISLSSDATKTKNARQILEELGD